MHVQPGQGHRAVTATSGTKTQLFRRPYNLQLRHFLSSLRATLSYVEESRIVIAYIENDTDPCFCIKSDEHLDDAELEATRMLVISWVK